MSLTLEQVRQTRFHLARRNGYEPVDVDNFVDKVEVTLAQLGEENDTLKQQVEALTAGGEGSEGAPPTGSGASEELRRQLEESHAEVERLRAELDGRSQQLAGVQGELDTARGALADSDTGDLVTRLQGELDKARADLADRDERIAALESELQAVRGELSTVQAAQAERTSKVEHIVVTAAPDAAPAVTKLLQMATEQAERLVGDAEVEAERITSEASTKADATVEEASAKAHEALSGARSRADEIELRARSAAEALTGEAEAKTKELQSEIEIRRTELFSSLETERDELRGKVEHLRSFEDRYRQSLTTQLRAHLDSLTGEAQPDDIPDVLNEPAAPSATPRLDALLNDQN